MSQAAKLLRWYFGIEAVSLIGIWLVLLWQIFSDYSLRTALNPLHLQTDALTVLAILVSANFVGIAVSGMAWWTLGKAKASARIWAIIASLANIPLIWIGPPMWIATAAGIAGLLVSRAAMRWQGSL